MGGNEKTLFDPKCSIKKHLPAMSSEICQVLGRGQQGLEQNKRRRYHTINLVSTYSELIFLYLHNMKVINLTTNGPTGELSVTWTGLLHFEKNLCW